MNQGKYLYQHSLTSGMGHKRKVKHLLTENNNLWYQKLYESVIRGKLITASPVEGQKENLQDKV